MNAAAVSRRASRGAPWANYGAGFKRVLRRVRMHCLQRPQEHLPPSRYGHPDPTWRSFGPERRCSPPAAATTLGPVFDAYSDVGFWLTPGGLAAPQKRSSESDFDSGGAWTMGQRTQAHPLPISISTLIDSRPLVSNFERLAFTSSRTSWRFAPVRARYACGREPVPASIGAQ
jgi:hypothetical protein